MLPPDFVVLDSSFILGPNSIWWRTQRIKCSIILVCRAWYNSGVAILYRDVDLRHFPELLNFLRSLKESTTNLGELVKSLNVSCLVPTTIGLQFEQLIQAIFKLCPALTSFTTAGSGYTPPGSGYRTSDLASYPPTITHLTLGELLSYTTLLDILGELAKNLIYLNVHINSTWVYYTSSNELLELLEAHGENLLFLHVHFGCPSAMVTALDLCPQLERMVTSPTFSLEDDDNSPLFHKQLKWIMYRALEQFYPSWVRGAQDEFNIKVFEFRFRHDVGHPSWYFDLGEDNIAEVGFQTTEARETCADWHSDTDSLCPSAGSDTSSEVSGGSPADITEEYLQFSDQPIPFDNLDYITSLLSDL
ncbi:hypothetical protein CPB83DRAFT_840332 [Crepidotus variabilis]|uniref:Uncharacterized protein n=1 Tax=Crepidotus variabilis TaxID=179855 RepID=A0A9P6E591_9AGAR|nr:hypothetical protein CPB83DRAFT_840332 [Crepidotus variabilis]